MHTLAQRDEGAVLVVEDDPDTCANLCDILEMDDLRVDSASTAAAALARSDWSSLSAVILDRKLPDGNALDLLPRIRRLAPQAAVIVVTGYADLDGAISALRNGAADYILKPVNADALRASLARIRERQKAEREINRLSVDLQRQKAELYESEERFRLALRDSSIAVMHQDRQLRYTWCYNSQWPGLPNLLGKTDEELFAPDDAARLMRLKRRVLESGEGVREEASLSIGGETRHFDLTIEPLRGAEGRITGLTCVVVDVTEHRRAEQRMLQSERLAAIGETMAGLVHEGRNALQRSKACLEMLALEVEGRPEALDLVARVQRAQDHLHYLYEEVRQYAAPLHLQKEPVDLRELWRETWSNVAHHAEEKELSLREQVEADDLRCVVDRYAIGQVIRNVMENAIQASPPQSVISVACRTAKLDKHRALEMVFRDQGPGLTAEQKKRIFEPFFTTKAKGTGLGMAIAHRIVQSHGGRIEVGAGAESGAEIMIVLPRGNR